MRLIISIDDSISEKVLDAFAHRVILEEGQDKQAYFQARINDFISSTLTRYQVELAATAAMEAEKQNIKVEVQNVTAKNVEAVDALVQIDNAGLTIDIPAVTKAVGFEMPAQPTEPVVE